MLSTLVVLGVGVAAGYYGVPKAAPYVKSVYDSAKSKLSSSKSSDSSKS